MGNEGVQQKGVQETQKEHAQTSIEQNEDTKRKEHVENKEGEEKEEEQHIQEKEEFQKEKKEEKENTQESEKIKINFKESIHKTKKFFKKHHVIFLLLILIMVSVSFRLPTASLPVTKTWAQNSINSQMYNQQASIVDQTHPFLPPEKRNALIQEAVVQFKQDNKKEYPEWIYSQQETFKQGLRDAQGNTYLFHLDPYYWTYYARNLIKTGNLGNTVKEGVQWDTKRLAPLGKKAPIAPFHAYLEAYTYLFLSFFSKEVSLMAVAFFLPVWISALAVIAMFFLAKRITNTLGAFFTALIFGMHPLLLSKTLAGISDTDVYNMLFPPLIFLLLLTSLTTSSFKKKMVYAASCGFVIGVYSFTWIGWWYLFDFTLIITCLHLVITSIREKNKKDILFTLGISSLFALLFITSLWGTLFRALLIVLTLILIALALPTTKTWLKAKNVSSTSIHTFLVLGVLSGVTAGVVTLLRGWRSFANAFYDPLEFLAFKTAVKVKESSTDLWPNVLTSVAELEEFSFARNVSQLGNFLLILFAIASIVLLVYQWYKHKQAKHLFFTLLLLVWLGSTLYAMQQGARFILLAIPAFTLAVGIGLGEGFKETKSFLERIYKEKLKKKTELIILASTVVLMLFILGFFFLPPFCTHSLCNEAKYIYQKEYPLFNTGWEKALTRIQKESSPDAIITSWWDYGHWFTYWADRAVTFDGSSQNMPQAYWVGKMLLTEDEKEAVGILRMLNCGGNTAYEKVKEVKQDALTSVNLVSSLVLLGKEKARNVLLQENFSEEEIKEILATTHCTPPESYVIVSDDMISKSGMWGHFGMWDFKKARAWQLRSLPKQQAVQELEKMYGKNKAEEIYVQVRSFENDKQANAWIAPFPVHDLMTPCHKQENENSKEDISTKFICMHVIQGQSITFSVDLASEKVTLDYQDLNPPTHLVYLKQGKLHQTPHPTENKYAEIPYSFMMIPSEGGNMFSALVNPVHSKSMFTRLYHFNGVGTQHFTLFDEERGVTNTRSVTWKVNWDGE
jgi:dolichyl-phosphooligosaccharide-protein glycotransferase